MANAINTPQLQINGIYIQIVPNSLQVTRGIGVRSVKAQANGSVTEPVFEDDKTEAVGKIEFAIFNTTTNISQIQIFQDRFQNNKVQITQDDYSTSMPTATVTVDPNYELGADKTTTVTMMGSPAV